jgi:hypothetical protein
LEIFKYSIASSVVKTESFSFIDTELIRFFFIFIHFSAKNMPKRRLNRINLITN